MGTVKYFLILALLCTSAWATNTCTFVRPSGYTGCTGTACTTTGIAADSGRAYWTGTGCTANGYIPTAPDSIVGPDGYTVKWDDRNFDMGASGNPYYSYPAYVVVDGAGTGYTTPPTATFACSGSCALAKGGTFTNSETVFMSMYMDMNGSGGVSTIRFRSLNGAWFSAASAAPTITIANPSSGTTATAHIVMRAGGGIPMILAHGSFQVQIGSGRNATFRGDAISDNGTDFSGIVKLFGTNTATFDSSSATPLGDGSRPMYSFGGSAAGINKGFDVSACAGTCTITSNLSGGHGIIFSHHSFRYSAAPQVTTGRETLSHLGSATTPMYEAGLSGYGTATNTSWNMPSYTCTDCGPVLVDSNVIWGGDASGDYSFIDGGIFSGSPGESNFKVYESSFTTGTRVVTNAIYDKGYGFSPGSDGNSAGIVGTTFTNSYLANLGSSATTPPGAITTSTILYNGAHNNGMVLQCLNAPLTHGLIYLDFSEKPDAITSIATSSASAIVSDIDIEAPVDPTQGGKPLFIQATPASPTNYTWTRINISPTKTNNAAMAIADFVVGDHTNIKSYMEHITMFGAGPNSGMLAIIMDEGGQTLNYPLATFKSNLIWSTHVATGGYNVLVGEASPAHDPCGTGGVLCDYNLVQSPDLSYSCPQCLNQARGYYSYFTTSTDAGGHNDLDLNPVLLDTTRRVATWYLDGLHKSAPTTWAASQTISVGDLRESANALFYGGENIAYRALRAHTSSATLRPDGHGFSITDSTLTSVVLSSGMARVNLVGTPAACVQLGDWIFLHGNVITSNEYRVTGVASDCSWFEGIGNGGSGTYTDSSLSVDVWKNWWEPASLYQLRTDIAAGTTYTDSSYSCTTCAPAQALQQWKFAGLQPTNETLRNYTYPGDTNLVTNPGAAQMSPGLPPTCSAGIMQSFRTGYSGVLDGSASVPNDDGETLTYLWNKTSGPAVTWTGTTTAAPALTNIATGSYTFSLTVTDGSSQSSTCTINDGAVITDNNNVVIPSVPSANMLLGPLVRLGANPWPWFDDRHIAEANLQIANMDTYYKDYWNTADTGTITVSVAAGTAVVGIGTTFTTTFCQGPTAPTVPQDYAAIVVWYLTGISATPIGHRQIYISSCTDNTHLTMQEAWASDAADGSGLSYADNLSRAAWSYNMSPANYYDNVSAFYALYYRSGIIDYLTAARKLADRFWESPQIDRGAALDTNSRWGAFPGRSSSAMGLVLRAQDNPPTDMWVGLRKIWDFYNNTYIGSSVGDINLDGYYEGTLRIGLWDEREIAYHLAMVSYCALYDPDPTEKAKCQNTVSRAISLLFTNQKFADGGWHQFVAHYKGWGTDPQTTVTVTHGSTTVTGSGTTWTADHIITGAYIWFLPVCTPPACTQPTTNAGGDPIAYNIVGSVTDTSITLDHAYEGISGSSRGWALSTPGVDDAFVGYGSWVYMEGLLGVAFDFAAKAIAVSDPTNSALAHSYNVSAANWIKTYGYQATTKSVYYGAQFVNCLATPCAWDVGGANGARVMSAESIRALGLAYAYGKDPTLKIFIDILYNAMWAKPGTCPSGSSICISDGSYIDGYDDGTGYMAGTPPAGQAAKWFGQVWGFSNLSSWPALRDDQNPRSVGGSKSVSGARTIK